ncbi:MAG: hypothetical protein TH68_10965 [Candidatus Synechococcus spongiarum 142]|uniref:Uncharacterized protein n=1 Tax=Candidatus Synechococcus spongiarum 142 TaxID=1608213 RepID=A0A6N3X0V9_9SYNE|nr:MAG: hypothetical protein TH68_10965 [Candidatus Synechococcus spongiarum 142]
MIGLSPLVMDTGAIALGGWSAPPQPRENQLKSRLVTALAWTLALLELVVAIALALSQALLMAMILIAPLESPEQGNQPEV